MRNYNKAPFFLIFFVIILLILATRILYNDTSDSIIKNYKIIAGDNLHPDGFVVFNYPYDYSHFAILSESSNFVDLIAISGIGEWIFPSKRELKVYKVRINLDNHEISQNEIFRISGFRPTGIVISQNNEIYFSYVDYIKKNDEFKGGDASLKVIMLTNIFEDNVISDMVFQTPWVDSALIVQTGGAIAIDPNSNLYLSIGDFDQFENPDEVEDSKFLSKYLILNKSTNKFSLFARGIRNSQGLYYSEQFDAMLFTDHGPYGGDEVNILKYNTHYGWPLTSYGVWYPVQKDIETKWTTNHEGYEKPIFQFSPSVGIKGISQLGNGYQYANLQALDADDAPTETLNVVISGDNTAIDQAIVVTVNSVNDLAVTAGGYDLAETETENGASVSGTVAHTDVDDALTYALADSASLTGTYGDFTFNTTSGAWTYTLATPPEFDHHSNALLVTSSKGLYMSNSANTDKNNLEFNRILDGGRDIVVLKSGIILQTQTLENDKDHISGGGNFSIIRNPNKLPFTLN